MLKGLAQDGGLFLPHQIPNASDWVRRDLPPALFTGEQALGADLDAHRRSL